jgi:hypothetical protein
LRTSKIPSSATKGGWTKRAANEIARDFKCGADVVEVIGQSGCAVELATRR